MVEEDVVGNSQMVDQSIVEGRRKGRVEKGGEDENSHPEGSVEKPLRLHPQRPFPLPQEGKRQEREENPKAKGPRRDQTEGPGGVEEGQCNQDTGPEEFEKVVAGKPQEQAPPFSPENQGEQEGDCAE